jgi:hypothetical protein
VPSPPPDHPDPDAGVRVRRSLELAAPRFACRHMSEETQEIVFRDNMDVLNWLERRSSYVRPDTCFYRMLRLDKCLRRAVNRTTLFAPPQDVDALLEPLRSLHNADCGSFCTENGISSQEWGSE